MKKLAIVGPTATGKTQLSIALAKALDGEILGMDSMQVYRHMDIGTAKATREERQAAPHHLLDIVEPWESFSVADYRGHALACLADVEGRGKTPIFCGGTGLYLHSLLYGLHLGEAPGDSALRQRLEEEYDALGAPALHARLAAVDRESAAKIHSNDKRRVVRALEVYELTGMPKSAHKNAARKEMDIGIIGLDMPREQLYARIDRRVDGMLEEGLVEEARSIWEMLDARPGASPTARQAIGYKELFAWFSGESSWENAVILMKQRSRNYAKRQWTWFRRDQGIIWIDANNMNEYIKNPISIMKKMKIV